MELSEEPLQQVGKIFIKLVAKMGYEYKVRRHSADPGEGRYVVSF